MKISARNISKGSVTHLEPGAVNAEVTLAISGADKIKAIVTSGTVQSLGLAVGKQVLVLVKDPSVFVQSGNSGVRLCARNCLAGTVTQVLDSAVEAEVTIGLPGGAREHAVITHDAVQEPGRRKGVPATAVFKPSSVSLGVAG